MTHMSPTVLLYCSVVCVLSFLYFTWHSWCFDRLQSLRPTRRRAFKCGITWAYLIGCLSFFTWAAAMAYIKYSVGYTSLPTGVVVPTPYPLWPKKYQDITPVLYYILVGGFSMLLMIYIEEMCFWIHLSSSIRGSTSKTWLASPHFKIWLLLTCAGIGTQFGVVIPVADNPQQMEVNAFLAGTTYYSIFTIASLYIVFTFPKLIQTVRKQGGSQVVLNRLSYQRKLTIYRIFARVIFSVPFLTVSIDGLTPHQDVAHNQFLSDLFIMIGLSAFLCSVVISVYMFFPPEAPTSSFLAGQTQQTAELQPTLGTDEQSYPPTSPSTSYAQTQFGLGSGFDSPAALGGAGEAERGTSKLEKERARQAAYEAERAERAQQASMLSIVAPFASPPAPSTPLPLTSISRPGTDSRPGTGGTAGTAGSGSATVPSQALNRSSSRSNVLSKRLSDTALPRGQPRTRDHSNASSSESAVRQAVAGPGAGSGAGARSGAGSGAGSGAAQAGGASDYAWSILAEHLKLPDSAMGLNMVAEMTEMDRRGWRAARRSVDETMMPANLRPPGPRTHKRLRTPDTGTVNGTGAGTSSPISPSGPSSTLRPFGAPSTAQLLKGRLRTPDTSAGAANATRLRTLDMTNDVRSFGAGSAGGAGGAGGASIDMGMGMGVGGMSLSSSLGSTTQALNTSGLVDFSREYRGGGGLMSRSTSPSKQLGGSPDKWENPFASMADVDEPLQILRSLPPPLRSQRNPLSRSPPTETPFSLSAIAGSPHEMNEELPDAERAGAGGLSEADERVVSVILNSYKPAGVI